ncbi:MAG TPA: DUF4962 domain-containing protein [Actinopolymorphaceae bacterium]
MIRLESGIDDLRTELTTVRSAQWRRLHEQCDWYRRQHPPAEHPTASITYFGPAAANLALAYRLTERSGYLEEAYRWIGTVIGYPHWGKAKMPDHDLDAGWLLHGLSLAYAWLGDDLGSERRTRLRDKLTLQGERLYDFAVETEGRWWSSSFWQNHNWICYAGLATAGYVLERPEWTERAKANFAQVIDLLPADGSDSEGVVYWRYGVPWLAIYLDLLQEAEGIDWWDRCRFLARTFHWRLHQCAPGFAESVDHGDCHDRRSGHSLPLYYKLASRYRLGTAQWLADLVAERLFWREAYESGVKPGVMPEAFLELLWYDPTVRPVSPSDPVDGVPTAGYFEDLGQVCVRTSWEPDATFLSFKASPGGGHHAWTTSRRLRDELGWETLNAGHHHPDSGSFVLAAHGGFLAVDDGYCNAKSTAHHNTILVDGKGYAGDGSYHVYKNVPDTHVARLRDVEIHEGWASAISECAAMYEPSLGVRRADRSLVMTPSGRLVLLDLLAADEPREWTYLLHSDWPPEQLDERSWLLWSGPGQARFRVWAPDPLAIDRTETEVEANPTGSTPSLRISKTLHTLRIRSTRRDRTHFLTMIDPTSSDSVRLDLDSGWGLRLGDLETVRFDDEGRFLR